jgi:hypothetical protein
LLAPWRTPEDGHSSDRRSIAAHQPRAFTAPVALQGEAEVQTRPLATPSPSPVAADAPGEVANGALQATVLAAPPAPAAALAAATAHVPVVLGALADPVPEEWPDPGVADTLSEAADASVAAAGASASKPAHSEDSVPAPVRPGSDKTSAQSKRRSRTKRSRR